MSIRRRPRRAVLPVAAALALAVSALPASAGAAEVDRPISGPDQINVTAAPGEVNRIRVSDDGPGFVRIRDDIALRESTRDCTAISTFEVRCSVPATTAIVLRQGDGDDRAEVSSSVRVGIDGAAGNDTYTGGLGAGRSNVLFRGGANFDTASYADASAHVSVSVGEGAGDGRAGDQDDIADAERIIGSRFGDELDASTAQPAVDASLDGATGNDILIAGGGRDVLVGGLGIDFISSRGGVDRVVASDGDRDTIDCGANAPDEALVSPGGESTIAGCENVVPVRAPATNRPGPPIGTLRLAPAAARVPAGGIARLRLSWRHPRGWRQLRRIELRIVHAGEAMGAVTIRPRGRRVRAHGAVKLVRRASRIGRKAKTVTARLALRLDRSLAGRRLRVEVEAADVGGARQLERRAGWIRVSD